MLPANKKPVIIAILIAYNAAKTLESFYKNFPKHLVHKIILVDDASKDNTYEIAKKLGIAAYQNRVNLGYGGNMKKTLALAIQHGGDILIDIHPDGEYLPSAIVPALEKIKKGAEFVLGNRSGSSTLLKRGMYFWKILPLMMLTWIDRVILGVKIKDLHQGFRVYTRRLLEKVPFERNSNNYLFSFEIISQAAIKKARIEEVPVETSYKGKKRGASLKSSIIYSLGTFKVLILFVLAKLGFKIRLFETPKNSLSERIKPLLNLDRR
jgi:glycosyltransferase involved in cell wall biosynthesis